MTLKVAIIADDLTGALDTGTPFVEAGLKVVVAIEVEALADALARDPEVLVVNTASRALPEGEAAARIEATLSAFGALRPDIVFKKIDSRLKGNVAAESMALSKGTGRSHIVVAPAIPDQQRFTVDGAVTGRGIDAPLPIRPLFPVDSTSVEIFDATTDRDLDDLVRRTDWSGTIAIGARGLGGALARAISRPTAAPPVFAPTWKTLFAFGSRDPITSAQIVHLHEHRYIASVTDAPAGALPAAAIRSLPAIARCSGEQVSRPEAVVARFAEGIRDVVVRTRPDMLMMGGGDTALAILKQLGASVVVPNGEIEAGIPWFEITDTNGRALSCAVKSGGFGNVDSLLKLVPENLISQMTSNGTRIEKQAW